MEDDEENALPPQYQETECEVQTVRTLGSCLWIFTGFLTVSWIFHSIIIWPEAQQPAWTYSLIWRSISHHTSAYKDAQNAVSPPPPAFSDGKGVFNY